jgi:hypothetical protein
MEPKMFRGLHRGMAPWAVGAHGEADAFTDHGGHELAHEQGPHQASVLAAAAAGPSESDASINLLRPLKGATRISSSPGSGMHGDGGDRGLDVLERGVKEIKGEMPHDMNENTVTQDFHSRGRPMQSHQDDTQGAERSVGRGPALAARGTGRRSRAKARGVGDVRPNVAAFRIEAEVIQDASSPIREFDPMPPQGPSAPAQGLDLRVEVISIAAGDEEGHGGGTPHGRRARSRTQGGGTVAAKVVLV